MRPINARSLPVSALVSSFLSVPILLPGGLPSMVKGHPACSSFGLQVLGVQWQYPQVSSCPKHKADGYPHQLPRGGELQPPGKVVGNGHWHLMNYLSAFWLHREAQQSGFAKFSNKKTLCFHSTSHSEVNSLGHFLHEAHVTLMPCPGIVYLPGWYWPLCVASWRTEFVPRLEGMPSRVSRWLSDYYFQPILPDHPLTVWTAVSFTSVLPNRIGDFSSALLFAQNINLSLFLTWPAVPSTCARLEQYITLARFCFLCSLQPINQTFFFLPPRLLGWFSTLLAPGCQLTLNHKKSIILWIWPELETSDRMRYAPEISFPLASFLSFSRLWGDLIYTRLTATVLIENELIK